MTGAQQGYWQNPYVRFSILTSGSFNDSAGGRLVTNFPCSVSVS